MSDQVFAKYAEYYNLLYRDKDYVGEARYVNELIQKYRPGARRLLNLGCGTGRHDFEFANLGYEVTGVDSSLEMLSCANAERDAFNAALVPEFCHGDIRSVRLGKVFDAVISLFHVMSYQTANNDLMAAIATARAHLAANSVFVFDCWYGPAVLTDPPTIRVKRLEDERIACLRIAEPVMHYEKNTVAVNYQVMLSDKSSGTIEEIREQHRMRYLFCPEVELFVQENGLKVVDSYGWLTQEGLSASTWNACFVVQN